MTRRLRFGSRLLLSLIGLTLLVWILRGLRILTFIPGLAIWILLLSCCAVAMVNSFQATR